LKSIEIPGSVTFIHGSAFLATPVAREEEEKADEEEIEEEEVEEQARNEALNAQNR
jgi:hypothetical protein